MKLYNSSCFLIFRSEILLLIDFCKCFQWRPKSYVAFDINIIEILTLVISYSDLNRRIYVPFCFVYLDASLCLLFLSHFCCWAERKVSLFVHFLIKGYTKKAYFEMLHTLWFRITYSAVILYTVKGNVSNELRLLTVRMQIGGYWSNSMKNVTTFCAFSTFLLRSNLFDSE
jgi:hypothetical protein